MSEQAAFTTHTARTEHRCNDCFRVIEAGERYQRVGVFGGGTAWTWKRCSHCRWVIDTFRLYDPDGVVLEDWAESPEDVFEARVMAGFRNRWRTFSGALWPLPAHRYVVRPVFGASFPFGRGFTTIHTGDRSSVGTFNTREDAHYWADLVNKQEVGK